MDADQPFGGLATHRVGDAGAHVAALGDVPGVAEAAHQLGPRAPDASEVPPGLGRLGREAVAGHGRQHEVERVLGASAVRGRIGERADGVDHLDDRAGPAVRHDQRQRVRVRGLHVDEVDVHAVDLGLELRQRVQLRLAPAPVVVAHPVPSQRLHRRQLYALGTVRHRLLGRPARRVDAAAQLGELLLRDVDLERADVGHGGHALSSIGCGRNPRGAVEPMLPRAVNRAYRPTQQRTAR